MKITFTDHANVKFKIFEKHGFKVNEKQITNIIEKPEIKKKGRKNRHIVQSTFDDTHVIRVICEIDGDHIKVITFYPARRERYEN